MTEYMLTFSLGSVQIFIEQARKARDLWLGSYLPSRLMGAAIERVHQKTEAKFVFPEVSNEEASVSKDHANLPNKYIAIFKDLDEAKQAVNLSKEGIEQYWYAIREDVWNAIVKDYATSETKQIWDEQTDPDRFFETFWVIVEHKPDEPYSRWLKRAEDALDARKRLRNFQAQNEPGEKSTLSGERQALHGAIEKVSKSPRQQIRDFWIKLTSNPSISVKVIAKDGSERLDAIDTIKRFAIESRPITKQLKGAFPSTSSIATASFVERLLTLDANKLQAWRDATDGNLARMAPDAIPYLIERAGANEWMLWRDGDCYFRETFTPRYLEEEYGIPNVKKGQEESQAERRAKRGQDALRDLLTAIDNPDISIRRPTPYYAIFKMDGDHMGQLLGKVQDRDEHTGISRALLNFADEAPKIIEGQYPGRLVYTGGDDALALVPIARDITPEERAKEGTIHTFLNLVDVLQQKYHDRVQPAVSNNRHEITASTGIAIAHHYTPLSAVLRATREAEEEIAKKRYGRNALVVTLMRRSGEQTRVGCHWRYKELGKDDDPRQPIKFFSSFYNLFDQDVLSPKCVYTLLDEATTLVDLQPAAQVSEIKRVLLRQRDSKKRDALTDVMVGKIAEYLVDLAAAMDKAIDDLHKHDNHFVKSVYLHEDRPRYGLVETLGWLQVLVFLTRKEPD